MNTTSKIALAAALFCAVASPSFAGDQDLASLQATSGRITGIQAPAGVYASMRGATHQRWTANWSTEMTINDRLAQGHN